VNYSIKDLSLEDLASSIGAIQVVLSQHHDACGDPPGAITAAILMARKAQHFFNELDHAIYDKIGKLTFDIPRSTEFFYFSRIDEQQPVVLNVNLEPNDNFKAAWGLKKTCYRNTENRRPKEPRQ
jgi:hypothetical protein